MIKRIDDPNRAELASWVESAQIDGSDFPVQNLPFGLFRTPGLPPRPGVAIGDQVLDLAAAREAELLEGGNSSIVDACVHAGALNPLLGAGRDAMARLRRALSALLRADTPESARARSLGDLEQRPRIVAEGYLHEYDQLAVTCGERRLDRARAGRAQLHRIDHEASPLRAVEGPHTRKVGCRFCAGDPAQRPGSV
ncbi:MAG: hypothetical protein ACHQRK_04300, partial [Gemmatimonadales bacterium]